MKPPNALAAKGQVVEEWIDLHFFRPLGFAIARRLGPTRATPDQVTLACLVLGLLAGTLFYFPSTPLNLLGVALFVASDVLDSADGQLARMRGSSTRFGRILDGVSDNLRFINLYLCLLLRLVHAGWGADALVLALAAGVSHSLQSAAVDFIRQAYLYLGAGSGSELDLPESLPLPRGGSLLRRVGAALYRDYVRKQAGLLPRTAELVRAAGPHAAESVRTEYRDRATALVPRCAWIGQNARFALLAVTAAVGWPAGFFWITVGPLNLILVLLVRAQESRARALLGAAASAPAVPTPTHVRVA
ncbi:MAG TPA: CDP-alcohol phosphatidyltransferase family protein [Gemmatimonadales bacterium]|nr:CDP-alcohol phosphatidyltransferase family protein [Gemmatimonadales bacterium]